MRRYSVYSWAVVVLSLGASSANAANDPSQHSGKAQVLETGTKVQPQRVAGIRKTETGYQLTTDWIRITPGTRGPGCPNSELCFDVFEPDANGIPVDGAANGGQDPECAIGGRWYFGDEYCNMFAVNDIASLKDPSFNGGLAERVEFAWHWQVTGVGSSEQCFIALFTAEDFDDTCTGPPASNFYDGIVFDFDVLDSGAGQGYYYADVCLSDLSLSQQLPMDGSGAYTMILANAFDAGTGDITLATCGQPMLWGVKNPAEQGTQGPIQWDDDMPLDGTHTAPDECYDYTFGLCPDPLGIMLCFYGAGIPPCVGDLDGDADTDLTDLAILLSNFGGGPGGDLDGDGDCDLSDLALLLSNFGCTP